MLSKVQKLGYGLGDLASNLVFQLSVIFLLFFYTDVMQIPVAAAGTIFIIARIWDAVNDPVMGYIMDKTKSKHGKARVYIRYGSLPLALATVAMFFVPDLTVSQKIIYSCITYIIWGMCFTLVNIPYSSLTSIMTQDSQERTELSSIRMIFMLIGVLLVSLLVQPIVNGFESVQEGYLMMAIYFSIGSFICFQLCFYGTKTNHSFSEVKSSNEYSLREVMALLFKNKQLLILTLASLLGNIAVFMRETTAIYYVTYNVGNADLLPVFLGVIVVSMVIGNLLIPLLTKKFDKKGTYILGGVVALVGSLMFYFVPYDNLVGIILIASFSSIGFAAISTLGWAMVPDTVEYGESLTGKRTEGIVYAVYSFSQKLATALSGGMVAFLLGAGNYVANAQTQTSQALFNILSTVSLIPALLVFLSMLTMKGYIINKKYFESLKKDY